MVAPYFLQDLLLVNKCTCYNVFRRTFNLLPLEPSAFSKVCPVRLYIDSRTRAYRKKSYPSGIRKPNTDGCGVRLLLQVRAFWAVIQTPASCASACWAALCSLLLHSSWATLASRQSLNAGRYPIRHIPESSTRGGLRPPDSVVEVAPSLALHQS